jgi:hypothetical protein
MKLFSKLRYFTAILLILISVSGVISPSRGGGVITTLGEPGPNILLESR